MAHFPHMLFAAQTDVGRKRRNNEDAYGVFHKAGIFCVADGMGGGDDGEVASAATIGAVEQFVAAHPLPAESTYDIHDYVAALERNIDNASAWILNRAKEKNLDGCGSTFVAFCLDAGNPAEAVALHAGDSRLYRIRGRSIVQITHDHSAAALMGVKNEDEVNPMFRGMILRAVGVQPTVEIEKTKFDVKAGDRLLLCSDGLYRMVQDRKIASVIRNSRTPQAAVGELIEMANSAGGVDNITAIVVFIGDLPKPVPSVAMRQVQDAQVKGRGAEPRDKYGAVDASETVSQAPDETWTVQTNSTIDSQTGRSSGSAEPSVMPDASLDLVRSGMKSSVAERERGSRLWLIKGVAVALMLFMAMVWFVKSGSIQKKRGGAEDISPAANEDTLKLQQDEDAALALAVVAAASNDWGRVQKELSGREGLTPENKAKIADLRGRAAAALEGLRRLSEEERLLVEAEGAATEDDWARVDEIVGGVKGLTPENEGRIGRLRACVAVNGLLAEAEKSARGGDWSAVAAILEKASLPPSAPARLRRRGEALEGGVAAARERERRISAEDAVLSQAERDADSGKWEAVAKALGGVKGLTPGNLGRARELGERRRLARKGELRSALLARVKGLVANEPVADRKARLDAAEEALWSATEQNSEIGGPVFTRDEVRGRLEDVAARRGWVVGAVSNKADFAVRVNGRSIAPGGRELFVFRNGMPAPWCATAAGYDDRVLEADFDGRELALANGDFRQRAVTMALPAVDGAVECVCGGRRVVDSVKLRPGTGYSCVYMRPGYERQTVRFSVKFNEDGVLPPPGKWVALPVEVTVPVLPDDVTCKVNDEMVRSGKPVSLLPGGYSLVYSRVDYMPQTTSFTVNAAERKTLAPPGIWEPSEGLKALAKAEEAMGRNEWDSVKSWLPRVDVKSPDALSRKSVMEDAVRKFDNDKDCLRLINMANKFQDWKMYYQALTNSAAYKSGSKLNHLTSQADLDSIYETYMRNHHTRKRLVEERPGWKKKGTEAAELKELDREKEVVDAMYRKILELL